MKDSTKKKLPDYSEGNESRSSEMRSEGLKVGKDEVAPEARYQQTYQKSEVNSASDASTPATGFTRKKVSAGGSALKQEVASKTLLSEADFAGVSGGVQSAARSGLVTLSYSGDAGTILGNAANTPTVREPSRSERRFEKKLDPAMKKINFLASEQVLTEYQNPAPLGESGDEVQGYYGTPKNANVRSQKSESGTPADLLVERSADELSEDMLFFKNGQYVRGQFNGWSDVYSLEPSYNTTFSANGVRLDTLLSGDDAITYSNYLPRAVAVTIGRTAGGVARIKKIKYTVHDAAVKVTDTDTLNMSSTALIRDMNKAEIARQSIDSKAGRETMLQWSPLGRAVLEPTPTVQFLSTVENDVGSEIFMAYKFASKAHAYQLNKTAKDGQRVSTPINEMLLGNIASCMSSKDYSDGEYFNSIASVFSPAAYKAGSASLLIAINDSVAKYEKKADILLNPKSLRHVFQIADNSMDVFRINREFAAAVNNNDAFSTIDRDYDPMLPVCLTDRVGCFSAIDWRRFGDMEENAAGQLDYVHTPFTYCYSNRASNYTVQVEHPLLRGVADYLKSKANRIYSVAATSDEARNNSDITITIPINHTTTCFSLWDLIVLASVPYMVKARINSLRDVIDYEDNFEYPFDLAPLSEINPKNAVNYSLTSIDEPLVSRRMIPSAAIRWVMPEFFWGIGEKGVINPGLGTNVKVNQYVMPWYFNEMMFEAKQPHADDTGKDKAGYNVKFHSQPGVMSMPVIRNGVRLAALDTLYSMSERDVRLCLDRLVCPPVSMDYEDEGTSNEFRHPYGVYKYGQANEGIPVISGDFTIGDYLATPRELGYFMHAPHGLLRQQDNLVANKGKVGFSTYASVDESMLGNTSYRLRCWKGVQDVGTAILQPSTVNVSRAQAFKQYWDCSPACLMSGIGNQAPIVSGYRHRLEVGFLVSMRQCFNNVSASSVSLAENQGTFIPVTIGWAANVHSAQEQSVDDEYRVIALHKGLWGRLQRLPMVISPFDTCDFKSGNGANYDPYDFAYMFGFAGMMASDYNQDLYNRTNHVQDQGWLYVNDDFIKDSPVFKDGIKYTM